MNYIDNNFKNIVEADVDAVELDNWLDANLALIKKQLNESGVLLVRGLPIQGSKKLARILTAIFENELIQYDFGSTPRTKMRGNIYTSTEYHPNEVIPLHNENSYSNKWAKHIAFYCVKAAQIGGETPIADSRLVYSDIPDEIKQEFAERKLLYVRNYGEMDLAWSDVFQTQDKALVENYCQSNDISYEWLDGNRLRTQQLCDAVLCHPDTKESLWFNQAHLFHISNHDKENIENLNTLYEKSMLPRNVYFGDGAEIAVESLDEIRNAYSKNKFAFKWQEGDLLLLDNMLYSHGRQPFDGERRVLVGMANGQSR